MCSVGLDTFAGLTETDICAQHVTAALYRLRIGPYCNQNVMCSELLMKRFHAVSAVLMSYKTLLSWYDNIMKLVSATHANCLHSLLTSTSTCSETRLPVVNPYLQIPIRRSLSSMQSIQHFLGLFCNICFAAW